VIKSITGRTIVFSNPLANDYRKGDLFIVIEPIVSANRGPVDGFTLRGGTIDGNRRKNPHFVAWEVAWSVGLGGVDVLIEDVLFSDCWGDCLKSLAGGLVDSTVRRTSFVRGSTAGIHLTGARNLLIESSVFRDLARDAIIAGHTEGAVTWSARNRDITIRDVCFEDISDQARAALADTNFHWNQGVYVYDNQFCRVPAIWRGTASQEPLAEFHPHGVVEIVGNVAVDAGHSFVKVGSGVTTPLGLVFSENLLVNSSYDWSDAFEPTVEDNLELPSPAECSCASWLTSED
jgi:hypothetical protein